MGRLLLALLVLVVCPDCSCSETDIRGAADSLTEEPDAEETDPGLDPVLDPVTDMEDTASDIPDAIISEVEEDSCSPDTWRGDCSIIEGCGCPVDYGWVCTLSILDSECRVFQKCRDRRGGEPHGIGETCGRHLDCQEGLICVNSALELFDFPGICRQMCKLDADCDDPRQTCSVRTTTFTYSAPCSESSPDTRPIKVCTLD